MGYVESLAYDLGGEHVEEIRYAGGVTWAQNYDTRSRLPRPGNITSLWTAGDLAALQPSPSPSTNRITGLGASYDARGNLEAIQLGGGRVEYTWDGLSKLKYQRTSTHTLTYLYDANDDRVLRWTCALGQCGSVEPEEHWTLRGLDGEVLRISAGPENRSYQWKEDYVYGDGRLLASVDAERGRRSLLLDHLGSVRRVVSPSGVVERSQDFYAFGQEVTTPTSDDPALKYTGHERDEIGPSARSLDYMRARYCSPELGRFLSVDPMSIADLQFGDDEALEEFSNALRQPQTWNRYTYSLNNPLLYKDPNGLSATLAMPNPFALGAGAGASAAPLASAGMVVVAGGAGYLVGTGINEIPGVSEAVTAGLEALLANTVFMAQNNRQRQARVSGLVAAALVHFGKINDAGGPERDPDFDHHKKEIKDFLEQARKVAQRLPRKAREAAEQQIDDLMRQVENL